MLQDLIYCHFLQCNNAQNEIWSMLIHRFIQEDSNKIYFELLMDFLWIYMNFWHLNNFLEFKSGNKIHEMERTAQYRAEIQPVTCSAWPSDDPVGRNPPMPAGRVEWRRHVVTMRLSSAVMRVPVAHRLMQCSDGDRSSTRGPWGARRAKKRSRGGILLRPQRRWRASDKV
jgi:hypothetical protein